MKAVVCGAGIAGLTAAQCLARRGWEVAVLERAPAPRTQGYMIDFMGPGYDAAEAMGILPRLRELGYAIDEAGYYDETGRRRAVIRYDTFAKPVGGRLLSIMRPDLELALRESLPGDVELRFGAEVTAVSDGERSVRVGTADGTDYEADLLIGADGVHSTVRGLVFGPERRYVKYLGFHTAAFTFADPKVQPLVRDRFCLSDSTGAQLGCYGLRDGRVAVFAVHRTSNPRLPADRAAALQSEYGGLGWIAPRVLAACPPNDEMYYDQVAQIVMPRWSSGHVVLVGDAGYAVSLLAGMGASLGIGGAYVLAEQVARAASVPDALATYERLWRPVVTDKQESAHGSARWFLPRSRAELLLRRAALRLFRLPGLDRYLVRLLSGKQTALIQALASASPSLDDHSP
ncbi:FAD-dependent oxidoreductase [Amycolatopsis sp. NPDC051903]|uniref:FAD-dependent oxidoreductase n=1 Tax=Amycolatopsis sp. NPDC051903 TaxID=3363936 RepID=UPI003793E1FF